MEIDPRVLPDPENAGPVLNNLEVQEPQQTPEGEATPGNATEELKHRAEVSSQNFERAKKAEAEVKELRKLLEEKKSSEPEPDEETFSDEGKFLKEQISSLKTKLSSFEENLSLEKISNLYPAIKDKREEFDEFRAEYPGISVDKVAKIFIAEKGYVEQLKPRIGLEKPTGGSKSQQKSGISNDEVQRLRENFPRRYEHMLRTGKIKPEDIV